MFLRKRSLPELDAILYDLKKMSLLERIPSIDSAIV